MNKILGMKVLSCSFPYSNLPITSAKRLAFDGCLQDMATSKVINMPGICSSGLMGYKSFRALYSALKVV